VHCLLQAEEAKERRKAMISELERQRKNLQDQLSVSRQLDELNRLDRQGKGRQRTCEYALDRYQGHETMPSGMRRMAC
jgi:hypothetical protein